MDSEQVSGCNKCEGVMHRYARVLGPWITPFVTTNVSGLGARINALLSTK